MAGKKPAASKKAPKVETPVEEVPVESPAEVPGWPGVVPETPEEHEARRRAEAEALAQ